MTNSVITIYVPVYVPVKTIIKPYFFSFYLMQSKNLLAVTAYGG